MTSEADLQLALERAHDALAFIGRIRALAWSKGLNTGEVAVAIAAAEIWAANENPDAESVRLLLGAARKLGFVVKHALEKLNRLEPPWVEPEPGPAKDITGCDV